MDAKTVFVVHTEWTEASDGGHSVVEGVFEKREDAEQHAREVTCEYAGMGNTPYMTLEGKENLDWDFDVHVEGLEVR